MDLWLLLDQSLLSDRWLPLDPLPLSGRYLLLDQWLPLVRWLPLDPSHQLDP